jgi:hypothetical protein
VPTLGIRAASLAAGATAAKVVVSKSTPVDDVLEVYDGYIDYYSVVACTLAGTECAALAPAYPGAHCATTAKYGNVCVTTQQQTVLFYVENVAVQGGAISFPVPCDGGSYLAELYSAASGAILDAKKTATPLSFDATCSGSGPVWIDQTKPALALPPIYAGLPAPQDRYTVDVQGVDYPWSSTSALTCNGASPISHSDSGATFAAPAAGTASVACTATFQLDRSILTSAELAAPWTLQVQGTAAVIGSTTVTGP